MLRKACKILCLKIKFSLDRNMGICPAIKSVNFKNKLKNALQPTIKLFTLPEREENDGLDDEELQHRVERLQYVPGGLVEHGQRHECE